MYKYSWERTQVWLRAKVDALGAGLKSEGVYVGVGSVSSSLVRSNKHINVQAGELPIHLHMILLVFISKL